MYAHESSAWWNLKPCWKEASAITDGAIARHIAPNMYISEMNSAEMAVCGERTQLGPRVEVLFRSKTHKSEFFFSPLLRPLTADRPCVFVWRTLLTYHLVFIFALSFPVKVKIIRNRANLVLEVFYKKEIHDATTGERTILVKIFICTKFYWNI